MRALSVCFGLISAASTTTSGNADVTKLDLSVEHLPRKLVGDYHDTKQSLRLRDFTEETEIEPEYEERGGFEKLGDLITKVDNATGMTGKLGDVVGRRRSLR
ncbi:hypothetical protein JG687_00016498 [Phytophthora cactorum]|uniref:RxLR effector protein n=1 Tax=Phytophthora cactorum TaxID=29920 RepID=A0A8T1TV07_9STRA|nr:hypothetical protein JG687_00016498 [Phytophthora cactorum]